MQTPINKKTLSRHLTYHWWNYVLILVLTFFAVDLLFTVTAPRTPRNQTVQFYVCGLLDSDRMDAYMEQVRQERLPAMREMKSVQLLSGDSYTRVQLTTYMTVGEGDLYLLPRDEFVSLAGAGYFVPLEEDAEVLSAFGGNEGSLRGGWRRYTETGETHLYGIPQSCLPGLQSYCFAQDGFLCVPAADGNVENALIFLRALCADMVQAPEEAAGSQPGA